MAQNKSTKDFTQIRQIKDDQGAVLLEHDATIERRKGNDKLLNEENSSTVFGDAVPNEGLINTI